MINKMWVLSKRSESRVMVRFEVEVSRWLSVTFTEQGNSDRKGSFQEFNSEHVNFEKTCRNVDLTVWLMNLNLKER